MTMMPVVSILLWLFMSQIGSGQQIEVPTSVQVPILIKILNFDRSLRSHDGDTITIAILYESTVKYSDAIADEFLEASQSKSFDSLHYYLNVITVDLSTDHDPEALLKRYRPHVIYLTPMRNIDLPSLLALCRKNSILSTTGVIEYVNAGVSVGIGRKRSHPEIIINLTQAKAEGAEFSSRLLKLARIIP